MRKVKWNMWRQVDQLEAFENFFLMALGLSTLFWIFFIAIIFLYIRLKAKIISREPEADEEEGQQQVMQEGVHRRVQRTQHRARVPVECVVQIVGDATTPHRPAPCLPRKAKQDAVAELDPPPRYEELDTIYDIPAI